MSELDAFALASDAQSDADETMVLPDVANLVASKKFTRTSPTLAAFAAEWSIPSGDPSQTAAILNAYRSQATGSSVPTPIKQLEAIKSAFGLGSTQDASRFLQFRFLEANAILDAGIVYETVHPAILFAWAQLLGSSGEDPVSYLDSLRTLRGNYSPQADQPEKRTRFTTDDGSSDSEGEGATAPKAARLRLLPRISGLGETRQSDLLVPARWYPLVKLTFRSSCFPGILSEYFLSTSVFCRFASALRMVRRDTSSTSPTRAAHYYGLTSRCGASRTTAYASSWIVSISHSPLKRSRFSEVARFLTASRRSYPRRPTPEVPLPEALSGGL